jgi:hypothetical protein
MAKLRQVSFAGILGLFALGAGGTWLSVWSHRVHSDPRIYWLTSDLPAPMGARLLVLSGAILTVGAGVTYLVSRLAKKPQ